jgi:hypothetical protein
MFFNWYIKVHSLTIKSSDYISLPTYKSEHNEDSCEYIRRIPILLELQCFVGGPHKEHA